MVNYYHDMWIQQSELLVPLTHLTSFNLKFEWTNIEQMAFKKNKQTVGLRHYCPIQTLIYLSKFILMPAIPSWGQ